jgi:hypothetical protein
MTAQLSPTPIFKAWANDGTPLAYGKLTTFAAGTTIKQAAYTDSTQSTPLPNPVILGFRGETPLWLDPTLTYKFVLTDFFGNTIPGYPVDNIPGGFGAGGFNFDLIPNPTNTYTLGSPTNSWAQLYLGPNEAPAFDPFTGNILYYERTPTEISNGVTPINKVFKPGNVFRFYTIGQINQTQSFSAVPTLDCAPAIINAIKGTTGDVFFPTGPHYVLTPIYIVSTAIANIRFVGESRTNASIQPMANNIADGVGINAMIINQAQNEKFSMYRIRLTTGGAPSLQTAWAGFGLHAVQPHPWDSTIDYAEGAIVSSSGNYYICINSASNINQPPPNASFWNLCGTNAAGYTAAACNVIFSGSINQCWFDAGGVQPFFVGGLINYFVTENTFEFQKGCFSLCSTSSDLHFETNSLSDSFDYFISCTQTLNANIISVRGLHVYTHNRGLLFAFDSAWSIRIDDVTLQAAPGAVLANGIGIGTFVIVNDLEISNLNVLTSSTLGVGVTATQLTFQGCSGTVSDSILDGCDIGILITQSAPNRLTFDHVDIINTTTAAFQTNIGTPSGLVTVQFCDWSDGQENLIISTTAVAFDFLVDHCRFMNAGLAAGGTAFRNLALATSGLARFSDCIVGQNNSSSAANYYIDNSGSGQAVMVDPTFVGTPPIAIQNPAATQITSIGRVVVPYSASITFSAAISDWFEITANNTTAFTINAPTSPMDGKEIRITIRNTAGSALGTVTWNPVFKLSTWTSPATANSRTIDFRFDGTNWIQTYQATVDVPN